MYYSGRQEVVYLFAVALSCCCCCLEAASLSSSSATAEKKEYAPVMQTESGKVRGIVQTVAPTGKRVYQYKGIKYGEAKRFRKPTPAPSWTGVYNATINRYACPQPNVQPRPDNHTFSEDGDNDGEELYSSEECHFLSVYRPEVDSPGKRAIMVWIHGGTYISGSAFEFDARQIAAIGDVVVVTVNYRLGALGFLIGDDDDAGEHPGNLGLYDIELALKYVSLNAEHFGGDAQNVTIFGESAGAMSVSSMMLSPRTRGLFRRAILQSGAANSFIGSQSRQVSWRKFVALATMLGCETLNLNSTAAMRCLEEKDVVELQKSVNRMSDISQYFEPTYGTDFLPESPVKLLKTGRFNHQTDLLFGVNRDEGAGGVYRILPDIRPDSGKHLTLFMVKAAILMMMTGFRFSPLQAEEVVYWYTRKFNNQTSQEDLRNAVANVYGDFNIICPLMLLSEAFVKIAPTNRYYSYRLVQPLSQGISWCPLWMGVCHAVDVEYVFGTPINSFSSGNFSKEDVQLSVDMITSWTNFAKTGDPGQLGGVKWEQAFSGGNDDLGSHQMMALSVDHYQIVQGFYKDPCDDFWKSRIFV